METISNLSFPLLSRVKRLKVRVAVVVLNIKVKIRMISEKILFGTKCVVCDRDAKSLWKVIKFLRGVLEPSVCKHTIVC